MTDTPSPTISEMLRKVDESADQLKQEVALADPTPSPMDLHRDKLTAIIGTASAVALDNCRLSIERQHALMRAVQTKREQVAAAIEDYLQLVQSLTDSGAIIHDALVSLEQQFGATVVIDPKANGKKS